LATELANLRLGPLQLGLTAAEHAHELVEPVVLLRDHVRELVHARLELRHVPIRLVALGPEAFELLLPLWRQRRHDHVLSGLRCAVDPRSARGSADADYRSPPGCR